jgi:serpin B
VRLRPLAIACLLLGARTARPEDRAPSVRPTDAAALRTEALGEGVRRALASRAGNLFLSPVSLALALAMGDEGPGDAARELDAGWRLLSAALAEGAGDPDTDAWRLRVAGSVWAQEGLEVAPRRVTRLRDVFAAPLRRVDFRSPAAHAEVDAWVARATDGQVAGLGAPDPETRLLVAHAVVLHARWRTPFDPRSTSDATFRAAPDREVPIRLMWGTGRWRYGETERAQVLELPYAGDVASLLVVLPKDPDGLREVESREGLAEWRAVLRERTVSVRLPRTRIRSEVDDLAGVLAGLGEPPGPDVAQVVTISIDEGGTEAAAVTVLRTRGGGEWDVGDEEWFVATHPFLLAIRHRATGALLFLGRVVDPGSG